MLRNRSRRSPVALVLVVVLIAALVGCGETPPVTPTAAPKPVGQPTAASPAPPTAPRPASGEPIKIGVVASLTGSEAAIGALQQEAYDTAVAAVNAAGGVGGRPLQLVVADDASSHERSVLVAEKLIAEDKLPLLIGASGDVATGTAAPAATRYQTPLIIPSSGDDAVLQQGSRWLFRVCAPASGFAKWAVDFIATVPKAGSVAVLYESTSVGRALSAAARQSADEQGTRVVAFESYEPEGADFEPALAKAKAASAEAVLVAGNLSDATPLLDQAKALDLNPKAFIGAGAGFGDAFAKPAGAGKNAEYVFASRPWLPDSKWPGATEIVEQYKAKHGEEPGHHFVEAYAALRAAADALKRAGSLDRARIRDALAQTDLMTVFGPIRFDQTGQNTRPVSIAQVQDGRLVTVYPKEAAAAEPRLPMPSWSQRP